LSGVSHTSVQRPSRHSLSQSTDADRLPALLARAGLSQRGAARLLNVDERTMRQWCAGQGTPPASVIRALSPRLTHMENLLRLIDDNEMIIRALQSGDMRGAAHGSKLAGPE
jgi:transcriptional regulator with XRE-family HTH domain